MASETATSPERGSGLVGTEKCFVCDEQFSLPQSAPTPQALDPAAAVLIAAWSGIPRDLLGESLEFAIGAAVNILAAIRQGDDDAVLAEFAAFDAAARAARHCAERLRGKQRLVESGGASS